MFCVLPVMELSVTCKVAEYDALAVGLKVTSITQLEPAVSELPQGVELAVSAKSDAFPPVTDMLASDSVVAPVFLSVTVLVVLLFGFWVPKLRLFGLKLARGSITSALSVTGCGLFGAESIISKIAVCGV